MSVNLPAWRSCFLSFLNEMVLLFPTFALGLFLCLCPNIDHNIDVHVATGHFLHDVDEEIRVRSRLLATVHCCSPHSIPQPEIKAPDEWRWDWVSIRNFRFFSTTASLTFFRMAYIGSPCYQWRSLNAPGTQISIMCAFFIISWPTWHSTVDRSLFRCKETEILRRSTSRK